MATQNPPVSPRNRGICLCLGLTKPYLEDSPFPLPASAPGQQLLSCKDSYWAEEQIDSLEPGTSVLFLFYLVRNGERWGGGSGFPRCKETLQELQGKPARDSGRNSFLGFARQMEGGGLLRLRPLQTSDTFPWPITVPAKVDPRDTCRPHPVTSFLSAAPPPPASQWLGEELVPLKKVALFPKDQRLQDHADQRETQLCPLLVYWPDPKRIGISGLLWQ